MVSLRLRGRFLVLYFVLMNRKELRDYWRIRYHSLMFLELWMIQYINWRTPLLLQTKSWFRSFTLIWGLFNLSFSIELILKSLMWFNIVEEFEKKWIYDKKIIEEIIDSRTKKMGHKIDKPFKKEFDVDHYWKQREIVTLLRRYYEVYRYPSSKSIKWVSLKTDENSDIVLWIREEWKDTIDISLSSIDEIITLMVEKIFSMLDNEYIISSIIISRYTPPYWEFEYLMLKERNKYFDFWDWYIEKHKTKYSK